MVSAPVIDLAKERAKRNRDHLHRLIGSAFNEGATRDAILAFLIQQNVVNAIDHLDRVSARKRLPLLGEGELRQFGGRHAFRALFGLAVADTRADRAKPADVEPFTDAGSAEFFARTQGNCLRCDKRQKRWLRLDSAGIWVPTSDEALIPVAIDVTRERQRLALDVADRALRDQAIRWMCNSESRGALTNMLMLARGHAPLYVDPVNCGSWDADPFLLGAPNGVIDLRTGALRRARPEEHVTMRVAVPYDPEAGCDLWESTVASIFAKDEELISYVQRAMGYSVTGDCREECLFFCWGTGANGKGTLMNTFAWVLRDYADDLPFSALELKDRSSIPNDVAKLVGKRFVTASESSEVRLNEARVKALTGRDPITARFMRAEFFTFQPDAKFWLATNAKPRVRDESEGFWRRIHAIPFTQSFVGREDKTLKDRLRAQAPGILAWAVRGCLAWQQHGLNPPAVVTNATQEYRREQDPLTPFLEACCVIQDGAKVQATDAYRAYQRWCDEARTAAWDRLSLKAFGLKMRTRFSVDERRQVFYHGVGLRATRIQLLRRSRRLRTQGAAEPVRQGLSSPYMPDSFWKKSRIECSSQAF